MKRLFKTAVCPYVDAARARFDSLSLVDILSLHANLLCVQTFSIQIGYVGSQHDVDGDNEGHSGWRIKMLNPSAANVLQAGDEARRALTYTAVGAFSFAAVGALTLPQQRAIAALGGAILGGFGGWLFS